MTKYRLYASHELTGRDGYPEAWHERLKHEVREAAGNRCIRCLHPYVKGAGEWSPCDARCTHGAPMRVFHGPTKTTAIVQECEPEDDDLIRHLETLGQVEAQWRILTVHHLDGDKANCRWWNLAALCQRCHLQIQGKVQMERVYPWPHSDWFKPYVAGYYAHCYLGEQLSREQVEARLDELLGLELAS